MTLLRKEKLARAEVFNLIDSDVSCGDIPLKSICLERFFLSDIDVYAYRDMDFARYGSGFIPTAEMTAGMLNVYGALACLKEEKRTFPFLKAIRNRMKHLEEMRDGDIEVVDFGCGALPIMGIMAALSSDRAKVICVEMNEVSAKMAGEVIEKHGLSDQITVVGDASKHVHHSQIDLRISETMFAGLMDEPLVHILESTNNQMSEDGFTIPSRIIVEASLSKVGYAPFDFTLPLQDVPVFNYVPGCFAGLPNAQICFHLPLNDLVGADRGMKYALMLGCRVELDDQHVISGEDSMISLPFPAGKPFVIGNDFHSLLVNYLAGTCSKVVDIRLF